ncbi:hypothetical protein BDQ17DRAFT_1387388 [Cyathus striatus]|nr:hypothetical protein BDQ17DRAFT_1387388 [Cyathus striatus]
MASEVAAPPTVTFQAGTAPVKAEYRLSNKPLSVPDDDAAEGTTRETRGYTRDGEAEDRPGPVKKGKWSKDQRKAQRGANKGRRFAKVRDELELCWRFANGEICEYGDKCKFTHDLSAYLAAKPQDLRIPATSEISESAPFGPVDTNLGTVCPVFEETGECRYGFKCRFLGSHEKKAYAAVTAKEVNYIGGDYDFPIANQYLQELKEAEQSNNATPAPAAPIADKELRNSTSVSETIEKRTGDIPSDSQVDTPDVPTRLPEKKRLHWTGRVVHLAPLTTVGNLPFRRICVDYVGLATSFLAGSKEEWSLVRRHPSEKIFGVQVAGNKPHNLVPTAEVLSRELGDNIDFVDVNCGCPIDLVFKSGSGSACNIGRSGKLGKILTGMNRALGETPVTVKLRTGVKDGKNTAHKLMPRLASEFKPSCITLHGRTRQQRYTRLADWDYIKQCVEAVRAKEADEELAPVPIFGGGDCFSAQDYWEKVESSGVDGIMIGRGALIKPWIFTEVKEKREWDISARERLDLIRNYAEYGLNHFGSDTAGLNATRRYLCESLSFQYRYVPIGLLEQTPGRINDRAPAFRGRSDLETLLASGDSRDWVKISEMFLGPAPESWVFTPKHKSNAYGNEEGQG